MNKIDNIFVEELKYYNNNGNNLENSKYMFKGDLQAFSVKTCEGSKPIVFGNNTFKYMTIDGSILTEDSITYLLRFRFYLCNFCYVSFKDRELTNDINQTVFQDCYFRKTKFDNVKLIGNKFINCSFNYALFISVIIEHTTFTKCDITFSQLKETIPFMPSKYRVKLTRNLLSNASEMGMRDEVKEIRNSMKEYSLQYYRDKTFLSRSEYYRTNSSTYDKIKYLFLCIGLYLEKGIFGFNLKIRKITLNLFLSTVIFAIVYYLIFKDTSSNSIIDSIVVSMDTLIGKCNL